MYRLSPFSTLEQPTYSWPWEKHGFRRSSPTTLSDCPCALLMLIAKLKWTGNCKRLNWNGTSEGMIGIRGMNTTLPLSLIHIFHFSIWCDEYYVEELRKIKISSIYSPPVNFLCLIAFCWKSLFFNIQNVYNMNREQITTTHLIERADNFIYINV